MEGQKLGARRLCECGCGAVLSDWGRDGRQFVDKTHARRWQRAQQAIVANMPPPFADALAAVQQYRREKVEAAKYLATLEECLEHLAVVRRAGDTEREAFWLAAAGRLWQKTVAADRSEVDAFELAGDELPDMAIPGDTARLLLDLMLNGAGVCFAADLLTEADEAETDAAE